MSRWFAWFRGVSDWGAESGRPTHPHLCNVAELLYTQAGYFLRFGHDKANAVLIRSYCLILRSYRISCCAWPSSINAKWLKPSGWTSVL